MKNVLWKFPQIPAEIPGYFYHIESLFNLYEVDGDVRLNFYKRNYLIKQSFFKVRLTKEQHGDYDALKEFLLNEFKIWPIQVLEQVYSLR